MSGFIVWMLFGGYVSLSPEAMAVTPQCSTVASSEPMEVKGDGAALVLRFPFRATDQWPEGVISRLERIGRDYPAGRLRATLYRANGTTIEIANTDERAAGNTEFDIDLVPVDRLAAGDKFVRVRICADPGIEHVRLYWRRVGK